MNIETNYPRPVSKIIMERQLSYLDRVQNLNLNFASKTELHGDISIEERDNLHSMNEEILDFMKFLRKEYLT